MSLKQWFNLNNTYPVAPELPPYMAAPPPWAYPPPSENTKATQVLLWQTRSNLRPVFEHNASKQVTEIKTCSAYFLKEWLKANDFW